jgi:hypothetical protein
MSAKIAFPESPRVPAELPLYATVRPAWNPDRVAELGSRLGVRGSVVDAGAWFIVRDGVSTLEVYQASHSFRFGRDDFDSEGRGESSHALDRDRAVAVAERFHGGLEATQAHAELHSVTEFRVTVATRGERAREARVVGLQVNHRYTLDGLPLVGPGAKGQVTVGQDGQLAQAYRFWRDVKRVGARRAVTPDQAFERLTATELFADLPNSAKVKVTNVRLGLLCLPPSETQGVLLPAYAVRGEVSTELLPRYQFVTYVAAAEVGEAEAKRNRWPLARPALLVA